MTHNIKYTPAAFAEAFAKSVIASNAFDTGRIIEQVNTAMDTAMSNLKSGRINETVQVTLTDTFPEASIKAAVLELEQAGFKAKWQHDVGYDDGPNRSTGPSDTIVINICP